MYLGKFYTNLLSASSLAFFGFAHDRGRIRFKKVFKNIIHIDLLIQTHIIFCGKIYYDMHILDINTASIMNKNHCHGII